MTITLNITPTFSIIVGVVVVSLILWKFVISPKLQARYEEEMEALMAEELEELRLKLEPIQSHSDFWIDEHNRLLDIMNQCELVGDDEGYDKARKEMDQVRIRAQQDIGDPLDELRVELAEFEDRWGVVCELFVEDLLEDNQV